jgi:hypothetical protein
MKIASFLIPTALLLAPAIATAQAQPNTTGSTVVVKGKKNAGDPNRQICRTMESTGSRLQRKRECRTASEWAEQQALDRQSVERSQASRWKSE